MLVTIGGYLLNVQGKSPLDLLPLAWTWLTVWLALSVGQELWGRWWATRPARRRDRRAASRPDDTF